MSNTTAFNDYLSEHTAQGDVWAMIKALLDESSLSGLYDFAQEQMIEGRSGAEIQLRLREQQLWKSRFGAIVARQEAGLPAISEAEVLAFEREARGLFRASGLPTNFYDTPDDFTKFLVGDVSLQELDTRITEGLVAVSQDIPEVREELSRLGYSTGDMVAYFLDETRAVPLLQRQVAAAQISARARVQGYGPLTTAEAENLAATGVTSQTAQQGFGELVASEQLFNALPGTAEYTIARSEQLGAAFSNSAAAQERIERKRAKRKAAFAEAAGTSGTSTGVSGLGSTTT